MASCLKHTACEGVLCNPRCFSGILKYCVSHFCEVPWKKMPRNQWTKAGWYQCSFHPGHSTTDQILTLQQIFEKSWEYAKIVYTSFDDLEKAYDWVPHEKLWECCGSRLRCWRCLLLSSHYIPAQKFVSVSRELNYACSTLVLDSDKVCAVTASFHSLHQGWPN